MSAAYFAQNKVLFPFLNWIIDVAIEKVDEGRDLTD
jgi:hypothetical protein